MLNCRDWSRRRVGQLPPGNLPGKHQTFLWVFVALLWRLYAIFHDETGDISLICLGFCVSQIILKHVTHLVAISSSCAYVHNFKFPSFFFSSLRNAFTSSAASSLLVFQFNTEIFIRHWKMISKND